MVTPVLVRYEVYPRVCGGTVADGRRDVVVGGLSPRVRGNRQRAIWMSVTVGSIPACAGEPPAGGLRPPADGVYPRVCGGTVTAAGGSASVCGLSPRVRGNPARPGRAGAEARSIPACAGEPLTPWAPAGPAQVYPRVCGGTKLWTPSCAVRPGLSPRVRGNPGAVGGQAQDAGSIPACAGEPRAASQAPPTEGVYPRVCGGTTWSTPGTAVVKGLSPRVRGNPDRRVCVWGGCRSIPACAGEPCALPPSIARR